MAEINIPKFKFKPPTQEMLFREIAEKEYEPVVEIISAGFRSQIEGDVFRIIHSYGSKSLSTFSIKSLTLAGLHRGNSDSQTDTFNSASYTMPKR